MKLKKIGCGAVKDVYLTEYENLICSICDDNDLYREELDGREKLFKLGIPVLMPIMRYEIIVGCYKDARKKIVEIKKRLFTVSLAAQENIIKLFKEIEKKNIYIFDCQVMMDENLNLFIMDNLYVSDEKTVNQEIFCTSGGGSYYRHENVVRFFKGDEVQSIEI